MRRMLALAAAGLVVLAGSAMAASPLDRTIDGRGNNPLHPGWGHAGKQYTRVAPANYADGIAKMVAGPPTRYVSNRVFNDVGQNLFSENSVSQWGWAWGQFMDHDFGLRDETPAEPGPIAWDAHAPLETFINNDFGAIDFARTPAAPGTGVTSPRQHINTITSYIDGSNVYGSADSRLDWLRDGSVDGNPENNSARLLLPSNYLPRANARGNAAAAPPVDLMGALVGTPARATVAGDVRSNENIALTAMHTLFAREHNRIVGELPSILPAEQRFQIARHVVGAELQFITYNEFLPALGVQLAPYTGYRLDTNAGLSNEFAVVGYRAHSMIHGEFEPSFPVGRFSAAQLNAFRHQGITVEEAADGVTLIVPLVVAFGNPDLLQAIGEGPMLASLGAEAQYKNDEQIDNSLRSVLFQVPRPGIPDPTVCGSPVINRDCYTGVVDLGAIDVERGRDHGMPDYNDLRQAYGLAPKASFRAITGEDTQAFPVDPLLTPGHEIDDPNSLDFVQLRDAAGNVLPPDAAAAVSGTRRTALAARLKAIYGNVDRLDAFVGMVSEKHVAGAEFGQLQLAIWQRQFEATRDGDRFFYAIDSQLPAIRALFGIDYRHTLAEVIEANTGADVQPHVFKIAG